MTLQGKQKIVGGMDEKVKQIQSILLTKIKNNMQCYIEKVVWKIYRLKRIFFIKAMTLQFRARGTWQNKQMK